jgi:osmotically-inducible protein OsmY
MGARARILQTGFTHLVRFTGACADLEVPMFVRPDAKSDLQLARDVAAELWWDASTRDADVAVSVVDGVVTLRGNVPSVETRQAAEAAARRVYGVQAIANELTVGDATATRPVRRRRVPPKPTPRDVRSEPQLPIREKPAPGWVLLTGVVGSERERAEAEQLVARMPGVLGVVNEIEVKAAALDPTQLRAATEEALLRRLEQELLGLHFNVNGDTVTVAGWVDSPSERHAILAALAAAPGVAAIKDAIRVDPWTA